MAPSTSRWGAPPLLQATSPCPAHLHFHEPPQVGAEVRQVDLAQRLHVLIPDLLGCCSLVAQQELIEEPGRARAHQTLDIHGGLLKSSRSALCLSRGGHLYFSRAVWGI